MTMDDKFKSATEALVVSGLISWETVLRLASEFIGQDVRSDHRRNDGAAAGRSRRPSKEVNPRVGGSRTVTKNQPPKLAAGTETSKIVEPKSVYRDLADESIIELIKNEIGQDAFDKGGVKIPADIRFMDKIDPLAIPVPGRAQTHSAKGEAARLAHAKTAGEEGKGTEKTLKRRRTTIVMQAKARLISSEPLTSLLSDDGFKTIVRRYYDIQKRLGVNVKDREYYTSALTSDLIVFPAFKTVTESLGLDCEPEKSSIGGDADSTNSAVGADANGRNLAPTVKEDVDAGSEQ